MRRTQGSAVGPGEIEVGIERVDLVGAAVADKQWRVGGITPIPPRPSFWRMRQGERLWPIIRIGHVRRCDAAQRVGGGGKGRSPERPLRETHVELSCVEVEV
jgi:hypothetical protein